MPRWTGTRRTGAHARLRSRPAQSILERYLTVILCSLVGVLLWDEQGPIAAIAAVVVVVAVLRGAFWLVVDRPAGRRISALRPRR